MVICDSRSESRVRHQSYGGVALVQVQGHGEMDHGGRGYLVKHWKRKITSVYPKLWLGLNFPDFYLESRRSCLSSGSRGEKAIYLAGNQSLRSSSCMASRLIDTYLSPWAPVVPPCPGGRWGGRWGAGDSACDTPPLAADLLSHPLQSNQTALNTVCSTLHFKATLRCIHSSAVLVYWQEDILW